MTERVPAAQSDTELHRCWSQRPIHRILWVKWSTNCRAENPLALSQRMQTFKQYRWDWNVPVGTDRLWRPFSSLVDSPLYVEYIAVEIRPLSPKLS